MSAPLRTGLEDLAFAQMQDIFPRVRTSEDPRIRDMDSSEPMQNDQAYFFLVISF